MSQPILEVNIETGKKAKEGAESRREEQTHVDVKKFLSAQSLKESLHISFDSLFLDAFAVKPAKAVKVERIEEAPRVERVAVEAPRVETRPAVQDAPSEMKPQAVETPRAPEAPQAEKRTEPEAPREASGEQKAEAKKTEKEESAPEEKKAEKAKAAEVDGESIAREVRAVHLEISGKLKKALAAEDVEKIVKEIDKLMADDNLSLADLVAAVSSILETILNKVRLADENPEGLQLELNLFETKADVMEIVDPGVETAAEEMRKYLKSLAARVKEMVVAKGDEKPVEKMEDRGPVEQKVDESILKLMKKLDKPERLAEAVRVDDGSANAALKDEAENREERRTENVVQASQWKPRVENRSEERKGPEKFELKDPERIVERQVADVLDLRRQTRVQNFRVQGQGVGSVGEAQGAGRAGDGGGQAQWQSSYHNFASQKGANAAQKAAQARPAFPQAQQNPVLDQIIQQAKVVVADGRGEATIKLDPEFLGKVEMKVVVEDKKASVRLVVETAAVRVAVTENIEQLRKQLNEAGLEVELISVSLSGESTDADAEEGSGTGEKGGKGNSAEAGGFDEDEGMGPTLRELLEKDRDGSTVRYLA